MERSTGATYVVGKGDEGRPGDEVARGDALRDPDQVLRNHPARAEVEVADLAVAHLPFGKADTQAARLEQGPGLPGPESLPGGRIRQGDGVAFALGAIAPPIQYDQDYGALRPRYL